MRAFLSHSSKDKRIVEEVYRELGPQCAWIDSAEIELGQVFLEAISRAIEETSDFILFWSTNSAESEWVRLELNMAFIRLIEDKAIRLRVISLDETPLPLHLRVFHYLKVDQHRGDPDAIVAALVPALQEPRSGARHRFLDRNEDLARIESAIDDPSTSIIAVTGFAGIGKGSLVSEALRRFFEGTERVEIAVRRGTGLVELAMQLSAAARRGEVPTGLNVQELHELIAATLQQIAASGQFLVVSNVQHWLSDENQPFGPLSILISALADVPATRKKPLFLTCTRGIAFPPEILPKVLRVRVEGLPDAHIATLLSLWYEIVSARQLEHADATKLASHLFGHPVAAKLAAGLAANVGPEFLDTYPYQLVTLRRDLAGSLLNDIALTSQAQSLMEALALVATPIPPRVLAQGLEFSDDAFQEAVKLCADAALIQYDEGLSVHPLLQDHYWSSHLHRADFRTPAAKLGEAVWNYAASLDKTSTEFSNLMPAGFRLFAISGQIERARELRWDLMGELAEAAIVLYNRRHYPQAKLYAGQVLEMDPENWQMRLYLARMLIREEDWTAADKLLDQLQRDRPNNIGVIGVGHTRGWRYLRSHDYDAALRSFIGVIAERGDHVASLRDGAECLHRLHRDDEALELLARAKAVESENAFVLDLEARILESRGEYEKAYDSALLASIRNPSDWGFHHRLGRIRIAQALPRDAIQHFRNANNLDQEQFTPLNSLVSALVDVSETAEASRLLEDASAKARNSTERAIVKHLSARICWREGRYTDAESILEKELGHQRNLIPNLGLYALVEIWLYDVYSTDQPAAAAIHLRKAGEAVSRGLRQQPDDPHLLECRDSLVARRALRDGSPPGEPL